MGNDIYQFSSFPWASFTHISHTESGKKDNATPMIDWGKYFIRDNKVILPFSVQVHHSFVDGVHIVINSLRIEEGKRCPALYTFWLRTNLNNVWFPMEIHKINNICVSFIIIERSKIASESKTYRWKWIDFHLMPCYNQTMVATNCFHRIRWT